MSILIICASERDGSNSLSLANALADGAQAAGKDVEYIYLKGKTIAPYSPDASYPAEDSCDEILNAMKAHQTVVFALPLYFFTMPAKLKAIIDRMVDLPGNVLPINRVAILATAADDNPTVFDALSLTFAQIADYGSWELVGSVLAGGVFDAGSVLDTPFIQQAYALGQSL